MNIKKNFLQTHQRMTKKLQISNEMYQERLKKLLQRGCNLNLLLTLDLQREVLGDFLELKHPSKKLLAVVRSFRDSLKLQHESGNASSAVSREKFRYLLANLWPEIVSFLDNQVDAVNFAKSYPDMIPLHEVKYQVSNQDRKARVARLLAAEGSLAADATELVNQRKYMKLWSRISTYPQFQGYREARSIANEILRYESQSPDQRKAALKECLEQNGCSLRSDSSFCNQFISGTAFATVQEVTAVMIITRELFKHSHVAWSQLRSQYESQLTSMVHTGQDGDWIESANAIVSSIQFKNAASSVIPMRRFNDYDDTFGYRQRKRHRWF